MAEKRILDPRTLDPIPTAPIGLESSHQVHERRQDCDINNACHPPVSNPEDEDKPSRAQKISALTSNFMLDQPTLPSAAQGKVLKPLSEPRLQGIVSDTFGGYGTLGEDDGGEYEIEP